MGDNRQFGPQAMDGHDRLDKAIITQQCHRCLLRRIRDAGSFHSSPFHRSGHEPLRLGASFSHIVSFSTPSLSRHLYFATNDIWRYTHNACHPGSGLLATDTPRKSPRRIGMQSTLLQRQKLIHTCSPLIRQKKDQQLPTGVTPSGKSSHYCHPSLARRNITICRFLGVRIQFLAVYGSGITSTL
jgi:hypothetical protein